MFEIEMRLDKFDEMILDKMIFENRKDEIGNWIMENRVLKTENRNFVNISCCLDESWNHIPNHSSYIQHQISNIKYQTSSIKHQVSNIKYPTSSIKHQVSNIKYQTSSIKFPTSTINHPTLNPQGNLNGKTCCKNG